MPATRAPLPLLTPGPTRPIGVAADHATALARLFKALGDPSRLRILALLGEGELCVCDLQAAIGIAQPLLSHHLRTLREAGVLSARKDGRWMHYAIRPDALTLVHDHVAGLRTTPRRARGRATPCCD